MLKEKIKKWLLCGASILSIVCISLQAASNKRIVLANGFDMVEYTFSDNTTETTGDLYIFYLTQEEDSVFQLHYDESFAGDVSTFIEQFNDNYYQYQIGNITSNTELNQWFTTHPNNNIYLFADNDGLEEETNMNFNELKENSYKYIISVNEKYYIYGTLNIYIYGSLEDYNNSNNDYEGDIDITSYTTTISSISNNYNSGNFTTYVNFNHSGSIVVADNEDNFNVEFSNNQLNISGVVYWNTNNYDLYLYKTDTTPTPPTPTTYTITYVTNMEGVSCNSTTTTGNLTATNLPTPTKTGYTFLGWYNQELTEPYGLSGQGLGDPITSISSNTTFYGRWASTITISYTSLTTGISVEYPTITRTKNYNNLTQYQLTANDLPTESYNVSYNGDSYHLVGWYDQTGQTKYNVGDYISSNTTLYAKYEKVSVDNFFVNLFAGMAEILEVEIFPDITLATLVFYPLVFGIILLLIKLSR